MYFESFCLPVVLRAAAAWAHSMQESLWCFPGSAFSSRWRSSCAVQAALKLSCSAIQNQRKRNHGPASLFPTTKQQVRLALPEKSVLFSGDRVRAAVQRGDSSLSQGCSSTNCSMNKSHKNFPATYIIGVFLASSKYGWRHTLRSCYLVYLSVICMVCYIYC